MKDLIKKQDEELSSVIKYWYESENMDDCSNFRDNVVIDYEELRDFISKVRKETTEYVCDKMTGIIQKRNDNLLSIRGYNNRIRIEKSIKKDILKKLK